MEDQKKWLLIGAGALLAGVLAYKLFTRKGCHCPNCKCSNCKDCASCKDSTCCATGSCCKTGTAEAKK